MSVENAFMVGLAYHKKETSPVKKTLPKRKPEKNLEWRILTGNDDVRQYLVELISELGDISFGPTPFKFEGIEHEAIAVPFEMVLQLRTRKNAVFVAFHEGVERFWTVSAKYSTGDISPYLGRKITSPY